MNTKMVVFDSNNPKYGNFAHFLVVVGHKLYLSVYPSLVNDVQEKAELSGLPFISQRFSDYENITPKCVRDQKPGYQNSILAFDFECFYVFNINEIPFSWERQAKEYIQNNSQDTHSKEYHKWLEEQAIYYNNGFYDADKRHGWEKTSYRDTVERISGGCILLYSAKEDRWDEYSHATAWAKIIKRQNKYVVYGIGGVTCGSDWMNYSIFFTFDSEEKLNEKMKTWQLTKEDNRDVTVDFIEFINKNLKTEFRLNPRRIL